MENQYGISIKNKYDLFLENDDPLEILKLQEEQKFAGKKTDKTKKSSPDKETKSSAKSKQPKASPVPAATETKLEKSEAPTAAKTDSDKQQKRQKPESNDSRLLKDRGNRSNFKNDQTSPQDSSGKLEIGTFENPGSSGSPQERRGRGRGFGGGFRGNNERSLRDGVDNGNERRPPRRGFGRPRNTFRNNENHENFQSPEETQQDGTGFPDEKSEQNSGEERRGGFRGRRGFRTFNGEQRGFGGPRRNFENRPPKRGFRNSGASTHDEHAELNGSDESRPSADHSTQQEQPASFGHWGAENETAGEDGTSGPATSNSGFGGSPRRGHKNIVPIEIKFADSRRGGLGSRGTGGGGGGGRRGNRDNYDRGGYNRRGSGGPGASRGGGPERRQQRERAPNVADEKDFPSLGAIANN
ncbi:hypothetical protein HELRODRAFT_191284 [Helobdella robusta]|uniref:Uncharacterized protein n=1 Tax=Helobdella robusta TaxID=6412 RepID=T1FSU4_HELRO|nr:hypothetical protein HELRODRAFT_191284 [Helobdella robusta]ESO07028.1 hypothetical protein HELRODRAFT_191284 [Helobdella robusta]